MCNEDMDHKNRCCEQGPQGVPGLQGHQGIQGVKGDQGVEGLTGLQGIQGIQGLQGVPGKDCDGHGKRCDCAAAYCNVYSLTAQVKGAFGSPSDTIMFDSQGEVSSHFDVSAKNSLGQIGFLKHGIYSISWIAQGNMTPPIPSPVPSFSFALWLDSMLLPGSVDSSFTQSPNDDNSHTSGQVIVEVKAGQKLTMKNASVVSVTMNPVLAGSVFPIANASVNIVFIKELP